MLPLTVGASKTWPFSCFFAFDLSRHKTFPLSWATKKSLWSQPATHWFTWTKSSRPHHSRLFLTVMDWEKASNLRTPFGSGTICTTVVCHREQEERDLNSSESASQLIKCQFFSLHAFFLVSNMEKGWQKLWVQIINGLLTCFQPQWRKLFLFRTNPSSPKTKSVLNIAVIFKSNSNELCCKCLSLNLKCFWYTPIITRLYREEHEHWTINYHGNFTIYHCQQGKI